MQNKNTQTQNTTPLPPTKQNKPHRSAYETPRVRLQLHFPEHGRTKQAFKDECDINNIMQRYQKTGILPETQQRVAQYLDATGFDFQASMEQVAAAKTMFEQIPAAIREKFENDPAKFVEFCENPANLPELTEMGLATRREPSGGVGSSPPAPSAPMAQPINPEATQKPQAPNPTA
ncbi:MAG: internal scaffolding protein [Microvirus sp.]|nr:MAG: internal scaffolding protein [Microvirus sp.]